MAPSPEYDKEPKAPDKNITSAPNEELKNPLGVVSDQINSDQKATTGLADGEIEERKLADAPEDEPWRGALDDAAPHGRAAKDREKATNLFKDNKHVETLDDGQLRALLDEAITYKCPKDREGKSSLFKELLEEVEQDEQAGEAAGAGGRAWPGGRARNPRALNACGSNSLQDLVAALAAEAAPRRRHAPVSARTHHGGSLPSGVDRSFLLSEEPMRGAGGGPGVAGLTGGGVGGGAEYVATVRCVNPEPLAERRVSASDTNHNATEMEMLNRRSMVPMYTARTTLDIGGGSVCSGRAVTTTTASNQVRTRPPGPPTAGPPERLYDRRPVRANATTNGGGRLSHEPPFDRNGRIPRGPPPRHPRATDNAHGPAPAAPQRKYDLEAYCRKKCKEDSIKNNKNNKSQKRLDPQNKHNQGRNSINESHETQHLEKYTFHSTDVPSYLKETHRIPQTHRKDSTSDFVFGESSSDLEQSISVEECSGCMDSTVTDVVVASWSLQANAKAALVSPIKTKCCQENATRNEMAEYSLMQNEDCQILDTEDKFNNHSKSIVGNYCGHLSEVDPNKPSVSSNDKHSLIDEVILDRNQMCSDKQSDSEPSSTETRSRSSTNISLERGSMSHSEIKIDIDESVESTSMKLISCNTPKENKNLSQIIDKNYVKTGAIPKTNQEEHNLSCKGSNLRQIQQSIINLKNKIKLKTDKSNEKPKTSNVDKIIEEAIMDYVDNEQPSVTTEINIDSEISNRHIIEDNTTLVPSDAYKVGDMPRTTYALVTLPVYEQNTEHGKYAELDGAAPGSDGTITADYSKTAFVLLPLVKHSKEETAESDDRLYNLKPLNLSENAGLISNSLIPILSESDSSANEILIFEPSRSDSEATNTETKGQVDSGIPFNCITTPEVVAGCTTTASAAAVDPKPRSVIASSFNGLPLTRGGYGANAVTPPDDYKKSVDENGNAVQNLTPLCSTLYGSNQHKKPRRKKSSKNETIIDLNLVDGYRGDKDVTELLRFIEPDAEHGRGQKLGRLAKHREDDKKRSTERRAKDKESKVKRASSLEELSRTKLEDLTDKPHAPAPAPARHKKDTASAHAPQKSERRSWGDDARDTYFYTDGDEIHATPTTTDVVSGTSAPAATTTTTVTVVSSHTTVTPPTVKEKKKGKSGSKSADSTPVSTGISASSQEPPSDATVELMDFQTVTKKRKQRKRYEENDRDANGGDLCYRKPKPASPERRRKSAPPSDKSNDSNDDMDSVHSLPADTGAERSGAAAAPSATGTPHASYADIARTRHNIPDLIESCNYYMDMDAASVSGPCPDVDDKPRRHDLPPSALPLPPAPAPVVTLPEVPRRVDDTHAYDPESYPALDCKAQRPKPKEGKASPPNKKPDKKIRALPDQPLDERSVNAHRVTPPGKPTQFDDAVENCTESGTGSGVEGGDEPGVEGADGSPPDVVADRRPPVILLDEAARPRDMDGITFGFDINEQLLNGEGEGCDLVPGVPVRSGLRYLPPRQHQHTQYHHQIVNYVGTAWEDIIRCGNGKVRYFTE